MGYVGVTCWFCGGGGGGGGAYVALFGNYEAMWWAFYIGSRLAPLNFPTLACVNCASTSNMLNIYVVQPLNFHHI